MLQILSSHFKKSVFFYQNVVSLVLGATFRISQNGPGIKAANTLFQDTAGKRCKIIFLCAKVERSASEKIVSSSPFTWVGKPYSPRGSKGYTRLVATKEQPVYYSAWIKCTLILRIHSLKIIHCENSSQLNHLNGKYATACLEHSSSCGWAKYEYADFLSRHSAGYPKMQILLLEKFKNFINRYTQVLKQDDEAPCGESLVSTPVALRDEYNRIVFFYVTWIFKSTSTLPSGRINQEGEQLDCRIMAEENR
ncbi:hypothetical protein OS493_039646, partial [Desmophyllum pertusum]